MEQIDIGRRKLEALVALDNWTKAIHDGPPPDVTILDLGMDAETLLAAKPQVQRWAGFFTESLRNYRILLDLPIRDWAAFASTRHAADIVTMADKATRALRITLTPTKVG